MAGVMIGTIMCILGLYSLIKGKLPFIKKYDGVKKINLHSRIEGTAVLLVGTMVVFQHIIPIKTVILMISILLICILTLICLLYTSPSPRDVEESRMPSSA